MRTHVYGSRDYLREFGNPQQPEDLDHHRLIVYGEAQPLPVTTINWLLEVAEHSPDISAARLYGKQSLWNVSCGARWPWVC